jgi:hypothetical protein
MANLSPSQLYAGFEYVVAGGTVSANSIVIPLSALSGNLTAEEADPDTGDGREVFRQLVDTASNAYNALATADRPAYMGVTTPALTSLSSTRFRKGYNLTFDIDVNSASLNMPLEA